MKSLSIGPASGSWLALLAILILFISSTPAQARITFYFEGEVLMAEHPLAKKFRVGQKFRGNYTFDETAHDPYAEGSALFEDAVLAMSFHTDNYSASARNGKILIEEEDESFVSVTIYPVSGRPVRRLSPEEMRLSWEPAIIRWDPGVDDWVFTMKYPYPYPFFNPDPFYPNWVGGRRSVYDAEGNQVYSENTQWFVVDEDELDFNQPFFYRDGTPAAYHGEFRFTFSNDHSEARVFGDITSITLVPQCNGWDATIYVDTRGRIVGGPWDGRVYDGVLPGTDKADVMVGTYQNDKILGMQGRDLICGFGGADQLFGGKQADALFGHTGNDLLKGENGRDELFGGRDNDTLDGGADRDALNGGKGRDRCINGETRVVNCEIRR